MNRSVVYSRSKAARPSSAVATTAKEAASNLLRLEFDRARLNSSIAQAESRLTGCKAELQRLEIKRNHLLVLLKR